MKVTNQLPFQITTKNIANIIVEKLVSLDYDDSFSDGLMRNRTEVNNETRYGFRDENLNLVIPFKYKYTGNFRNGLAIAQKEDNNYTIIDKTGKEVLHGSYPKIFDFDENTIIALRKTGGCTKEVVIDLAEKTIYETIYECNPIRHDNRIFKIGNHGFVVNANPRDMAGKDILINRQGEVIPTDNYTRIDKDLFSPYGIVVSNEQDLFGAIDYQGREIVPCKFEYVKLPKESLEQNPLAVVGVKMEILGEYYYGYFNIQTGKMEIDPRFERANPFYEGLAVVTKSGVQKYINPTGKTVFDGLKDAPDFKNDLAIVEIPGKLGSSQEKEYVLYSHLGPISQSYDIMRPFQEGYSAVRAKETNLWGVINKMGKEIFPCYCQYLTDFKNGMAFAKINDQYFKIDSSLKIEEFPKFDFITRSLTDRFILSSSFNNTGERKEGIYDLSTKKFVTEKVRKRVPFQQQSELEGKQVVSCQYLLTVRMGETVKTYVFATIEKRQEFLERLVAGQTSMETPLPKVRIKRK